MKSGIKILLEEQGEGPEISFKDRVIAVHSCCLNRGDVVYQDRTEVLSLNDRDLIAGLRYGMEGMRVGGHRRFQASPHLCYSEEGVPDRVPSNALLVFDVSVKSVE